MIRNGMSAKQFVYIRLYKVTEETCGLTTSGLSCPQMTIQIRMAGATKTLNELG